MCTLCLLCRSPHHPLFKCLFKEKHRLICMNEREGGPTFVRVRKRRREGPFRRRNPRQETDNKREAGTCWAVRVQESVTKHTRIRENTNQACHPRVYALQFIVESCTTVRDPLQQFYTYIVDENPAIDLLFKNFG